MDPPDHPARAGDIRMIYPHYKVEVWPEDDPLSETPTELFIASGQVPVMFDELSREFTFSLPANYNFLPDDYASSAAQQLKRGVRLRVTVSTNGFADDSESLVI